MKLLLASLLATAATSVLAQGDPSCLANYIVEACLGTENGKLAACGTNDYVCRCTALAVILTCYNNCPNDPRRFDTAGQQTIFCGYASQFPSSTTSAFSAPSTDMPSTPTGIDSGSGSGSSGSGSSTAAAPTKTGGAAGMMALSVGGVLAGVAGVVAAVL
ncbi:hypothetical protein B0T18DRAFT_391734 [Schizothecium vesticola]|uniref:GPI anchored serine-threonine rich protein n=1 Tax=Schizothecium vesticola TaxID=314040 RepID=A0AA40ENZ6_9PEZI|nr:hypothetical protein B0T18DRAFT_391734 [Schizothecium vesticola]